MKNKEVALILALLPTGWFGAHHLYVGNKKRTILYTLFIWTTIPIILSFIDAIILSRMSDERFIKKHSSQETYLKYIHNQQKQLFNSELENNTGEKRESEPDFSDFYGPWMDSNENEDKK